MSLHSVLGITYGLLVALLALHAVVLRHVLRETLWFKQLIDVQDGPELPVGSPMPDFRLPVHGEGRYVTARDLRGQPTTLVFVSADKGPSAFADLFGSVHAFWHRTSGHIFLVCAGSETACDCATSDLRAALARMDHELTVLVDRDGSLANTCSVTTTPSAILFDQEGKVIRHGTATHFAAHTELQVIDGGGV